MYNLIQTMDALRSVPLSNLTKYVDGTNPQVPSYIALMELNRRKQANETSNAFYGQQPTLKDQLTSSLTQGSHLNAPTGIKPAQMQGQVNPAAPPVQLAAPMAPPAQVNLTAAPPKMMAEGGLSSLPTPNMFNQNSYASGGILHFVEGGDPRTEALKVIENLPAMPADTNMPLMQYLNSLEGQEYLKNKQIAKQAIINNTNATPDIEKMKLLPMNMFHTNSNISNVPKPVLSSSDAEDAALGLAMQSKNPDMDKMKLLPMNMFRTNSNISNVPKPVPFSSDAEDAALGLAMQSNKVTRPLISPSVGTKPLIAPSVGTKPSPTGIGSLNTGAAPKTPVAPATPSTSLPPSPKDLTDAELYARHKELEKLAGVKEDPYSDIKQRYADIEDARKTRAKDDPYNRIMERLTAFGMADPSKGFAHAAGASAVAGSRLEKEQNALHDKEGMEMAKLQESFAKEEDARRRGDVAGVEAARAHQEKIKMDLAKLGVESKTAEAHMISALANKANVGKPSDFQQRVDLYRKDPTAYEKMFGKEPLSIGDTLKLVYADPENFNKTADEKQRLAMNMLSPQKKVTSMAEIETTAKRSNKTVEQVKQDALARGYTIQ